MYCSLKTVQEQAQSTRSIKLTCHRHINFLNFEQVVMGWNVRDSTVWDFKMWLLTVLMGDHINRVFYKEMYGRFAGLKKSGCNNEVTVFTKVAVRLGSTVMKYEKVRIVNHCYAIFLSLHQIQPDKISSRSSCYGWDWRSVKKKGKNFFYFLFLLFFEWGVILCVLDLIILQVFGL